MKRCPICEDLYPRDLRICPRDGIVLVHDRKLAAGSVFRETYRIVRHLGKGGMGDVYLAEHLLLGQPRALKFLSTGLNTNSDSVQRFLREARRAAEIGLHHPNIVKTLDVGQDDDGEFFIVMEYVEGRSLAALIEESPNGLPFERVVAIIHGIAMGLHAAHSKGIVHRDIKPGNILLASTPHGGEVAKICDFGLVTGSADDTTLTRTGLQPFTPAYAAPEQWRGSIGVSKLDGRTDLYALGCVFFQILTGSLPYQGTSAEELMHGHLFGTALAPSQLRPDLGRFEGLDALLEWMLKKDRDDRPANVPILLGALGRVKANLGSPHQVITKVLPSVVSIHRNTFIGKIFLGLVVIALLAGCVVILAIWGESNAFPWDSKASIAFKAKNLNSDGRYRDATPLLAKACNGGDVESCDDLGAIYDAGITHDPWDSAIGLYRRACDGGYTPGCKHLGDAYFSGTGTNKDYNRGLFYYGKACDREYAPACDGLGGIYSDGGDGPPIDFRRAARYFERGCDLGYGISCERLSMLYLEGHGVPIDMTQANYFMKKACNTRQVACPTWVRW